MGYRGQPSDPRAELHELERQIVLIRVMERELRGALKALLQHDLDVYLNGSCWDDPEVSDDCLGLLDEAQAVLEKTGGLFAD